MTRKHFEAIAEAFSVSKTQAQLEDELITIMARDNGRFSRQRFLNRVDALRSERAQRASERADRLDADAHRRVNALVFNQ